MTNMNTSVINSKTSRKAKGMMIWIYNAIWYKGLIGVQLGIVNRVGFKESCLIVLIGFQIGFFNFASRLRGFQLGYVNIVVKSTGIQLGIINIANRITDGYQIGALNYNASGGWHKWFPIINW